MKDDSKEEADRGGRQRPIESVPDEVWNVLIVGAGPAGSVAAIHLASRGRRVLLLDKKLFPRDEVCGDGLIADSIRCLRNVGLYEAVRAAGHEASPATVFGPGRIATLMMQVFGST